MSKEYKDRQYRPLVNPGVTGGLNYGDTAITEGAPLSFEALDTTSLDFSAQIVKSLKETGFAVVKNSIINATLKERTLDEWTHFFGLSRDDKDRFIAFPSQQEGYFPFKSEKAKDSKVSDLKEFYHLKVPFTRTPFLHECTELYPSLMYDLGIVILNGIQQGLPAEVKSKFSCSLPSMMYGPNQTILRVLHYPPMDSADQVSGAIRAEAHEDINLITLLPVATEPGLQILDTNGVWRTLQCDANCIIINTGDMLQEATDGYLKSTTHRVVNPSAGTANTSRYSTPLFLHPRADVVLSSRYTAESYLNQRLKEIGLKK